MITKDFITVLDTLLLISHDCLAMNEWGHNTTDFCYKGDILLWIIHSFYIFCKYFVNGKFSTLIFYK